MKAPSSSRALVGMQPQFRHVPPRFSFSTHSTFFLSCPARMAAAYPAGPPPMTTMSYWYLPGWLSNFGTLEGVGGATSAGAGGLAPAGACFGVGAGGAFAGVGAGAAACGFAGAGVGAAGAAAFGA